MKASAHRPSVPVAHHHNSCPLDHKSWPDDEDKAPNVRPILLLLLLPLLSLLLCPHLPVPRSIGEEVHNGIITKPLHGLDIMCPCRLFFTTEKAHILRPAWYEHCGLPRFLKAAVVLRHTYGVRDDSSEDGDFSSGVGVVYLYRAEAIPFSLTSI